MNCPVCLAAAVRPHIANARDSLFECTARTFSLMTCKACGSVFLDPLPSEEELATFYPRLYWWDESAGWLKTLERIYRRVMLRDHVAGIFSAAKGMHRDQSKLRLLDVGCGGGTLLKLLHRRGLDGMGFEFSSDAARIATASGVRVVCAHNLKAAHMHTNAFDIITLFHVMEHVPDPRGLLTEARRILAQNGRLLVQVPNIDSWQAKVCGSRWYGLDVPRHVINYSDRSIRRLLSDCGFRIRRVRHFNVRDNAPALASSIAPRLDPMSRYALTQHRNQREGVALTWAKHAAYAAMVAAVYPIVLAEAACRAGGTVTLEAEKA